MQSPSKISTRTRILDAALQLIRMQGYAATSVEDLCRAAGVTKGAFFHHFKSKEELGVAAAMYWSETTGAFFAGAPYHQHADPLDRVRGYIDFRAKIVQGTLPEFTCLVGTMVQEAFDTSPAIRDACGRCIADHAARLEQDIEAASTKYGVSGPWTPKSLALHTQAVLQGAFVLAKAMNDPEVALESIAHLKRYVECLFAPGRPPHADVPV